MVRVRETTGRLWRSYSVAAVVVALGVALSLLSPRFLQVGNLLNVLTNAAVIAIVGLGMTLAIASGNFDLSVGATAAFSACIAFTLVPVAGEAAAVAASDALRARGLWVPAIRPPTVPAGSSRLRITFSAAHESADVDRLLEALAALAVTTPGTHAS